MKTYRTNATLVGVLYIVGTVAGVLSMAMTAPVLNSPDFLQKISVQPNQMILGAFFVLVMGLALAMIPAILYPIAKKYNEVLALGYVIFRGGLETVTYLAVALCWLLLPVVSQSAVQAGASGAASAQALGAVLQKAAEVSSNFTAIVFPIGAMLLYSFLYQSRLIPRWISVWGLIAVGLHFALTGLLGLFGVVGALSAIEIVWNLPIFLQEMVMAVWLIVKGFDLTAMAAEPTKTVTGQRSAEPI